MELEKLFCEVDDFCAYFEKKWKQELLPETEYLNPLDWLRSNIERNYAVRLMLLASAGNPHRHENISVQVFDNLINAYHSWDGHTISDSRILEEEVEVLLRSILQWEIDHENPVRNWSLKLSDLLNFKVIRSHIDGLFIQRMVAFQNAGFGYPLYRNSFKRIPEVKNPQSNKDKRADFLIETSNSYIVVECKSSVMSSDTSAYFQADKLADLWCRIHSAFEQISSTVEALNLHDKPVIPLIITFYDSIAASTVFEEMVKQTDYCSRMGLNMPPIVYSLHELEHWISDRSLNNWSELILLKQNANCSVKPDNKGHN